MARGAAAPAALPPVAVPWLPHPAPRRFRVFPARDAGFRCSQGSAHLRKGSGSRKECVEWLRHAAEQLQLVCMCLLSPHCPHVFLLFFCVCVQGDADVLPPWQAVFDEDSGLYYYWNENTDEVTWQKPTAKVRHSL